MPGTIKPIDGARSIIDGKSRAAYHPLIVAWSALVIGCAAPLPEECSPAAICPGATEIVLDAGTPPIFVNGQPFHPELAWWYCVCGEYGEEWHTHMDQRADCLVARQEWHWCPLAVWSRTVEDDGGR